MLSNALVKRNAEVGGGGRMGGEGGGGGRKQTRMIHGENRIVLGQTLTM